MREINKVNSYLQERLSRGQILSAYQLFLNGQDDLYAKKIKDIWGSSQFCLTDLELRNFRAIERLHINFEKDVTVLIGENGTGKTAILESVAKCLSVISSSIRSRNASGVVLREQDIYVKEEVLDFCKIVAKLNLGNKNFLTCELAKARAGYRHSIKNNVLEFKLLAGILQYLHEQKENLPIIVYYGINRSEKFRVKESLKSKDRGVQNPLNSLYDSATFNGALSLSDFEDWFLRLSRLNTSESQTLKKQFRSLILKVVPFIEDVGVILDHSGCEHLKVKIGSFYRDYSYLSDGQRLFLGLIFDLGMRLLIANSGKEKPFEGMGVVLIDEIELHLHPKWQREIIPSLRDAFPNIQFLITTHSPQVISSIEARSLRLLCRDQDEIKSDGVSYQTDGATSSEVLEELMNLEPRREGSMRVQALKRYIKEMNSLDLSLDQINEKYEALEGLGVGEGMLDEALKKKIATMLRVYKKTK